MTDVEAGEDDAGPTEFSSPPCFLHELDAGTAASLPETSPERRAAILREHRELIAHVKAGNADEAAELISRHVEGFGRHVLEQMRARNADRAG